MSEAAASDITTLLQHYKLTQNLPRLCAPWTLDWLWLKRNLSLISDLKTVLILLQLLKYDFCQWPSSTAFSYSSQSINQSGEGGLEQLGISERPLSTQFYSASASSVPLFFPFQRLSLIHPHRRVFVSRYFFVLTLVSRVLKVCWNFWVANTVTGQRHSYFLNLCANAW